MTKVIILTGGIASGKSTVSSYVKSLGYPVIDADQIARLVVQKGSPGLSRLKNLFTDKIISPSGELDRHALGEIIFNDEKARKEVDRLLHPLILEEIKRQQASYQESSLIFIDVPLYIEAGWDLKPAEVWLIYVPEEVQRERLKRRDHLTEEEATARLKSQMPIEEKRAYADRIIDNTGTQDATYLQVDQALEAIGGKHTFE